MDKQELYNKIHAETCSVLKLIPEDIRLAREVSNYKFTPEIVRKELLKTAKKVKVQVRTEKEAIRDQEKLQEIIESKLATHEKQKRLNSNRRNRLAKTTHAPTVANINISEDHQADSLPVPGSVPRRLRLNKELAAAEQTQKQLKNLKEQGSDAYVQAKMDLVLAKLNGEKVLDDPAKIKKSLKELDSKKKKAAKNAKEAVKKVEAAKRAAAEEKIANKEKRLDDKATKILQKKGIAVKSNNTDKLPVAKKFTRKERHEYGEKIAKLKEKNNDDSSSSTKR